MAEVFARHYSMGPHEDLLGMEGWTSVGTDIAVVEDQGAPFDSGGSEHCTRHVHGKDLENSMKTASVLSDDGDKIIRSVIAVKFMQRDTYLNVTPEHSFFEAWDNSGNNRIWSLYYEGFDVNDNVIGIKDSNGLKETLDAGPFTANTWYIFDLFWKHNTSTGMWYLKDKIGAAQVGGRDFHVADGDIGYKVRGQLDPGTPVGPGGIMYCSYVNHFTDVDAGIFPSARCKKYFYRPYNYYGKAAAVVKRNGTTQPGDILDGTYGWEKVWNELGGDAAIYQTQPEVDHSGLIACDRTENRGPAGQHPLGTVALVATNCFKYTASTKGADDRDPHMSWGQGNTDLDTFTIASAIVARGPNLYFWKHLNPGDTGFPTILQFAMLGMWNQRHDLFSGLVLNLIECHCTYVVEDRGPPLTQIKMFGKTLLLGLTTLGAKE